MGGAYHRILPPGTCTFNIETPDYPDVEGVTVTVGNGDAVVVPNQEIIRNTQPPFITLTEEPGLGGSGVGLIIIFAVVFVLLVVAAVGFRAYKTDKFRYRQNVTNDVVGNDFDDVDTVPTDGVPMDAEKADLEVASRDAPAVPDDGRVFDTITHACMHAIHACFGCGFGLAGIWMDVIATISVKPCDPPQ